MSASTVPAARVTKCHVVSERDLPLSCPMPDMTLWNAHPRVYLPIEKNIEVSCPYCGACYVLESGDGTH